MEHGKNAYLTARVNQERLYELYNRWYNAATVPIRMETSRVGLFESIFKNEPRILKRKHGVDTQTDIKKMLYKELRRSTLLKCRAWRRYQNNIRFNLFCISVYRKKRVDVSFARYMILEYLHG